MHILLLLLPLLVADHGAASALRDRVSSLVGQKLTSSSAIIAMVNEVDEHRQTALHHAVILGDLPLVEFFLANGVDTRATDYINLIPLQYAEQLVDEQPSVERMQVMSLVLEKTRGVDKGGTKGLRPIVWSILAGDLPRVTELIAKDADIFSGRKRLYQLAGRHNAVWAAEFLQDELIIKLLAEHAPDKYFPPAIANGYRKFVQAMIERDVDVNVRDDNNYTALMHAAKAGRIDDVRMLIDLGAKVDNDVLILAAYSGNPRLVRMIIDYDVDVNAIASHFLRSTTLANRNDAFTALEMVLEGESKFPKVSKGRRKIIRMLFEYDSKIDFFTGNYQQLRPKIIAGNARAMEDLFTFWQLHKQKQGYTLQTVAYNSEPAIMKTMLSYLADADSFLPQGIAALAIAKIHNQTKMAQMLIEHASAIGINVDKLVGDANLLHNLSVSLHVNKSSHHGPRTTFNAILIEAIAKTSVDDVQKLIEYGVVPRRAADFFRHYDLKTLGYLTTSKNLQKQIDIMKMLAKYWQEGLPLPFAVAEGNHQLIKKAIDSIEGYNQLGTWQRAIRVARFVNDDESLKLLLSSPRISRHLEMIASMAIKNGDYQVVKLALENGANPDGKRLDGHPINLLTAAAKNNDLSMIELLLAYNANPNFTSRTNIAPILAVAYANISLSKLYDYVVSRSQKKVAETRVKILERLVAAGAEINTSDHGNTALSLAIMLFDVELVEVLLRLGADRSQGHYQVNKARSLLDYTEIGSKEKQQALLDRLDKIEQMI